MALGWLKRGTALAVVLIATFVLMHPDVNRLDGIFHPGHGIHQDFASGLTVAFEGLPVSTAITPLETASASSTSSTDSLDLLCARLC